MIPLIVRTLVALTLIFGSTVSAAAQGAEIGRAHV